MERRPSSSRPTMYLVKGPPGSGKSTVVPFLLSAWADQPAMVAVPTRAAAISLAWYVHHRTRDGVYALPPDLHPDVYAFAGGREIVLRGRVGYAVRGSHSLPYGMLDVHVAYVTTGILIQYILSQGLSGIFPIVDEIHLRQMEGDLAFALILKEGRSFAVMSATMEQVEERIARLARRFGYEVVEIELPAPQYPIRILEWPVRFSLRADQPAQVVLKALRRYRHLKFQGTEVEVRGDQIHIAHLGIPLHALIFMPGVREIEATVEALRSTFRNEVIPLYGAMAVSEQEAVVERAADRRETRVFVSTELAGVSLTMNAGLVLDLGLVRRSESDTRGFVRLPVVPISRAEAAQRAGRAGRTAPGICVRCFRMEELPEETRPPETLRTSPERIVLVGAALGLTVRDLPLPDPPSREAVEEATRVLRRLEALDARGRITPRGYQILELGLPARLAVPLLTAWEAGEGGGLDGRSPLFDSLIAAVSLLAVGRPWRLPGHGPPPNRQGDLNAALGALVRYMQRFAESPSAAAEEARALGFADRVLDEAANVYLPDLRARMRLLFMEEDGGPDRSLPELVDERQLAGYLAAGFPDMVGLVDWKRRTLETPDVRCWIGRDSGFWRAYEEERPALAIALAGTFSAQGARIATAMIPVEPEALIRAGVARVKERRAVRARGGPREEVLLMWRGVERSMAVRMIVGPDG
ncbi:helicase-related protein [Thermoflexus sp.]|uniref:helicase-related protein n=1 Tax=Thermoflexus sp. TaxID=1969742 RepID=UPI0025E88C3F|nr:helicase-related protein [Thermoflexus sp.]MCS6963252.1 helicase-related protein [Thermoflexus sp.]MDW8065235.1 helicase-related protein [Anaerolineae bacterium]MDW8180965.1 helicase-related protein [Anaerolineae bacterium]MDW8184003.1 helicase-related protein [Anaerolineae bacterium]